jgi:hypothetical protein
MEHMKITSLAALAATAFVMSATLASASTDTIDFDRVVTGSNSYTADGFTISSSFSIAAQGGSNNVDTIRLADFTAVAPVPVPPSLGFLATGLAGFAALRGRRRS